MHKLVINDRKTYVILGKSSKVIRLILEYDLKDASFTDDCQKLVLLQLFPPLTTMWLKCYSAVLLTQTSSLNTYRRPVQN